VGQDSASVLATATKELADFFDSTGWYADVHFFDDVSHPSTKNYPLHADGSNHVFIWLREGLTQLWRTPVRMISLSAKPVFDIAKGQVTLSWWVSGLEDFTSELPIASFEANYLGMTVATLQ
jgi:hypothetical protein